MALHAYSNTVSITNAMSEERILFAGRSNQPLPGVLGQRQQGIPVAAAMSDEEGAFACTMSSLSAVFENSRLALHPTTALGKETNLEESLPLKVR